MSKSQELKLNKLKKIFKLYPEIKLVYLFGSRVNSKEGPLSDYDFAFYLEEKDSQKIFKLRMSLIDKLSRLFKTDEVDVVILNTTQTPELKYNIIKEGKLIYEKEPFRVLIEPRILNEYFDFHDLLSKYNLTKV